MTRFCAALSFLAMLFVAPTVRSADPIPPISRRLPPPGLKLEDHVRANLNQQLERTKERFAPLAQHAFAADVDVFVQAVRLALKHGEFYSDRDVERAHQLLETANKRVDELANGKAPWTTSRGLVVRGYVSSVDHSVQPYGLVIPEKLNLDQPVPLYVWLHGRGDKSTNLAFLHQRQAQAGRIAPEHAIVLHPWGRHCVGYKSAGEIDVLEAVDHVASQYKIDRRRIVLMGFSMGGAGCWHVGAHYADRWVAMSPGAGFAETARYQHIDPQTVPSYERSLWGTYDVPGYVRNLFNLPVVAYSGEVDKQIQAARVMEEAFAGEGRKLDHRIGPGMGHRYHPDTLAAIMKEMKRHCDRGLDRSPREVHLQTRTLRYHQLHWVDVQGLEQHWQDSRVDAERIRDDRFEIQTVNVTSLRLTPDSLLDTVDVVIDGQTLHVPSRDNVVSLRKQDGRWSDKRADTALAKRPGLQGPIDDAFLDPFLVVLPSGRCEHPAVQRWVDFEQAHFLSRWEALFRGTPRVKRDHEVTGDDLARYHVVLWGDPSANRVLGRIAERLPVKWTSSSIRAGKRQVPAADHVLSMIYPNPESPDRYVVINSGPTFREGHDRTNSLQNPKLPDWAVIDLTQPPDALTSGRIALTDFFDERWQLKPARSSR